MTFSEVFEGHSGTVKYKNNWYSEQKYCGKMKGGVREEREEKKKERGRKMEGRSF